MNNLYIDYDCCLFYEPGIATVSLVTPTFDTGASDGTPSRDYAE